MEEATPAAGKLNPSALNTRAVNSSKGPKQTTFQEMERTPTDTGKSPSKKKARPKPSVLGPAGVFETTTAGACQEISMLFSEFAQMLSERAAADSLRMKELEGLLEEARQLESRLKEKKRRLKQALALISEKLPD